MSISKSSSINFVILVLLFIATVSLTHANDRNKLSESEDLIIEGQKEFLQSCAICHGDEGKGDGPYFSALVNKPTDLTQLLIENEGEFPFIDIYLIIDGREISGFHGARLMPIWGDRFSEDFWSVVSPDYASTLVRGRIFELLLYIYSIQEPAL